MISDLHKIKTNLQVNLCSLQRSWHNLLPNLRNLQHSWRNYNQCNLQCTQLLLHLQYKSNLLQLRSDC
jgi:hypothetical protein